MGKIASIRRMQFEGWEPPALYSAALTADRAALRRLIAGGRVASVHDQIDSAITELFDIEYPEQKDTKTPAQLAKYAAHFGKDLDEYGVWAYQPWDKRLVHFPPATDLHRLRTSRNRNLVTAGEQAKLYGATVCVIGMSVGSNAVEALVGGGIGGKLVLVDMDHLEPSNLNRIRAPYHHVGLHKVDAIARKISEIDPYIKQAHYREGLNEATLNEIITNHRPDVLIDEMDDVRMKLRLRLAARRAGIPVIMAADDGDGILMDIERYDLTPDAPLFHGLVPQDVIDRLLSGTPIPRPELGVLIGKYFVGFENTPLRMFQSLREVGRTLPSWPQLGGAAAMAGVVLAYAAKRIIAGQPLNTGRHLITPDDKLNPEINSEEYTSQLAAIIKALS
ncbi:MAG TPA: ThiF family adenylyltransferase [Candidatus Saccharimonadia bacterium]|jgi:molybdopterin/thiamine biosynthesis adenylyltransferase|nr:ThiF family adenylyltransferase [Candidatus Saccharimonadia bacterium]